MDNSIILDKFRGCLLGALIGDCFGAPYEGESMKPSDKQKVQKYFDKMQKEHPVSENIQEYTDDTAMTISVSKFLAESPDLDFKHLAKLFVTEYYNQPNRGYGANIVTVFDKLRKRSYENVFEPAAEQFKGQGSLGNGGAMRIAPVALFFHDDYDRMVNVACDVTRITHSHALAIHGALAQCMAVQQALELDHNEKFDSLEFCKKLSKKIKVIEEQVTDDEEIQCAYQNKLRKVEHYLEKSISESDTVLAKHIIKDLGNNISAYDSVCTAIYCYLRAQDPIEDIKTNDMFQRTIQYAITLGGDTDTIASMAGAIAGAHLGEKGIKEGLKKCCESFNDIITLADKLYDAKFKK